MNIQCIAAQPIDGIYIKSVTLADIAKQFGEAGAICCKGSPADAAVVELLIEAAA